MTLRARLTAAFLAVVLGPVLLGAGFVAVAVGAVSENRSSERLEMAATGVRTAMDALCQRLRAAAETAALLGAGRDDAAVQRVVDQRLARAVQLINAAGIAVYTAGVLPPRPWADCSGANAFVAYNAVVAHIEISGGDGRHVGDAYAVEPVDPALVKQLATAGGVAVTVLTAASRLSTERRTDLPQVVATATNLRGEATGETENGRYVRRVDQEPGQPLLLALSVRREQPQGLYLVLIAVVLITALASVTAAWWLARSTTWPLTELAVAADRIAGGDLGARVSVRTSDEVGRLATTFNRMARETQGYVQALTASRDQLRGHLGLLGDTLSSTHDVERTLQTILESALSAVGAQAGVLLLADPAAGELVGQCAEGLTDCGPGGAPPAVRDLRVRVGDGLLGAVAASGEARRGRVDRDGPQLAEAEPRCRTYVAVPFAAPGPTAFGGPTAGLSGTSAETAPGFEGRQAPASGVLAGYDRHGFDEFDDADLATLRTFAGQAAVAVDNVRVHEEAQRLSLTDPLTGLSNYRYLKESLRREVERASRFGHQLTVLALDLDRFKEVNDTHGHAAGDAVLAELACRVRAEIREVDLAFRQGGEEFVVLLPETDAAGGTVVAERLGMVIRRTPVLARSARSVQAVRIPVTVSIGIAVYPDHGATGAAVLEAAADALYQAKTAGRDVYRVAQVRAFGAGDPGAGGTGAGGTGSLSAASVTPSGTPGAPAPPRARRGG